MDNQSLFDHMPSTTGGLLPMPPAPPIRQRVPARSLSPAVKLAVLERDGWVCQACHILCAPTKSTRASRGRWATVDHIVPLSRGGWDNPVNLQTLCYQCNADKGEQIIDYRADVALRLALDLERESRALIPDDQRLRRGQPAKGAEKLEVVLTCRVTRTEAEALRARYGSGTYAARAGVDRLLYAG